MIVTSSAATKKTSSELFRKVLVTVIWAPAILFWISAVVARLPVIKIVADFFTPATIIILILVAFPATSGRIKPKDVCFYLLGCLLFLLSYAFLPQNGKYLEEWAYLFLISTLPYLFLGLIIDYERDKDWLYYASLFTVFVTVLYRLFYLSRMGRVNDEVLDDMNAAYGILPHLLLIIWRLFEKVNVLNLLAAFLGSFFLVSLGTRGPVLFLILFVLIYFFLSPNIQNKKVIRIVLAAVAIAFLVFFTPFMDYLDGTLTERGLSTRVIESALNRDVESDLSMNERSFIQSQLIRSIESNDLGLGMGGTFIVTGTYAHNIVLDFLVDFGIIGGIVLLLLLSILLIRAYLRVRNRENCMFFIILLLCGFGSSFFSWSYMNNKMLYFLIGYSLIILRSFPQKNKLNRNS